MQQDQATLKQLIMEADLEEAAAGAGGVPRFIANRTPLSVAGAPRSFAGTPISFAGTPMSFADTPISFAGTPCSFTNGPVSNLQPQIRNQLRLSIANKYASSLMFGAAGL